MKPIRIALALLVFVTVLSAVIHAAAPQGPTGAVLGTVLKAGTNEPIPDVQITLATDAIDPLAFQALRVVALNGTFFTGVPTTSNGDIGVMQGLTDGAFAQGVSPMNGELLTTMNNYRDQTAKFKVMTDSRGQFAIPDVPAGAYSVRAARDGYFGEMASVINVQGGQQGTASFSILPGATITGRVRGEDGEFIAGATVGALSVRYQNGAPVLTPALFTKTNFRGEYRLFWLTPGEYIVAATEEPVTGLELPIPTYHPDTLDVTRSTPTVVKSGDNVNGVDVQVRPARKVHVSGTVSIPQLPPAAPNSIRYQVMAALIPRDRNIPNLGPITSFTGQSGLGGEMKFQADAPPGPYDVAVSIMGIPVTPPPVAGTPPAQQPQPQPTQAATTFYYGYAPVDVGDRDITVAVIATAEAKARVTLAIDGAPPAPVPPPGIRLYLLSDSGGVALGNRQAVIDANGEFVATAQPGVRLRPQLTGLPSDVYITELRKDGVNVLETGLTLSADAPTALQIIANSGGGVVQGTVRSAAGTLLRALTVALVPTEARRQNKMLFRTARSDGKGQFIINGIAPGDYKLFAWENMPGDAFLNARYLSRYENSGIPVTVAKGSATAKDLTAIPSGQ